MLMRHKSHGWHNANGAEVEEMKKNGWVESSVKEQLEVIAAKFKPVEEVEVIKPRIGRPRKE
jgi:hypothetical protein